MNFLAIDQSLSNSGIAVYGGDDIITDCIKPKTTGTPRLIEIKNKLIEFTSKYNVDLLIMEEYAFSQHGHAFSLGELGGMIKMYCYKDSVPLLVMPIGIHKMHTTGKGNSKKDVMIKEVYKKYRIDTNNDNIADAISILMTFVNYVKYRQQKDQFNQVQVKAFKKLSDTIKLDEKLYEFIEREVIYDIKDSKEDSAIPVRQVSQESVLNNERSY